MTGGHSEQSSPKSAITGCVIMFVGVGLVVAVTTLLTHMLWR